jgi:hypothetical protein
MKTMGYVLQVELSSKKETEVIYLPFLDESSYSEQIQYCI